MFKRTLIVIVLLSTVGIGANLTFAIGPQQNTNEVNLAGTFYNLNAQAGGNVTLDNAVFDPDSVAGYMNFTELPSETTTLCGAGNLTGTRMSEAITASFVSDDPDTGCTFDKNGILTITGTIQIDALELWGSYSTRNSGGSNFAEGGGVFELWQRGQQPPRTPYVGTFINTNVDRGGSTTMAISIGTQTVSGHMNFTNKVGEPALCGAGEFTGIRQPDNTVELSFISNDPDAGCGFDRGDRFIINGTLSEDLRSFEGTYQSGTFIVTIAQEVYLPLIVR